MDSILNESTRKVNLEAHYKTMITDQNAQIYKQYARIAELVDDNKKLKSEVERLSELLKLK